MSFGRDRLKLNFIKALFALAALNLLPAAASANPLNCDESIKTNFKPDAQTKVILVKQFRKGDSIVITEAPSVFTPRAANDLCLVKLIVGPGNPGPEGAPSTSPGIGIEIWLPNKESWDGRIHNTGGRGGLDGGNHTLTSEVGWFFTAITAGTENTVSASTDMGHNVPNASFGLNPDKSLNKPLWADYGHRAMHEMAVKTKALVLAFYGRPQKFAYYEGSSSGGRHAYSLAQRYPGDYDGIIGHLPALNIGQMALMGAYKNLVIMRDLGGVPPSEAQQDLVSNAAINACDVVGGQHMGYIMDNASCRYDPRLDKAVLCASDGESNTTTACVSRKQATAILKWWYGPTTDGSVPDPAKDNGVSAKLGGKHLWYGYARGTSLYNVYFTKLFKLIKLPCVTLGASLPPGVAPSKAQLAGSNGGFGGDFLANIMRDPRHGGEFFKHPAGNGEGLYLDWSYAQLAQAFAKIRSLDTDMGGIATDNPDLSAFKARGGKFISLHGWNDEAIPVQGTIRYYDAVVRRMGGLAKVQDFFRLYLVPGGGHESNQGTSNPDARPPKMDQAYALMRDWVEKGTAPGRVDIKTPVNPFVPTTVKITQPVCPYPQKAVYVGGDVKVAGSFVCR
jgi:hypothetical protein